MSKHILHLTYS